MRQDRINKQALDSNGVSFGLREKPGTKEKAVAMSAAPEGSAININGTGWSPELESQWLAQSQNTLRQQTARQPNWRDVFKRQAEKDGLAGGYDTVKRFVRQLEATAPLPSRRMECDPGDGAQVDFGTGAPVRVVYQETQPTRSLALKREAAIKAMSRQEKESLERLRMRNSLRK